MSQRFSVEAIGCTHSGRRANNEDYFCANDDLDLFAVADGMGGYQGGEVASRVAIGSLLSFFQDLEDHPEQTVPVGYDVDLSFEEGMLDMAVQMANRQIIVRKTGRLSSMGTTVAVLVVREDQAIIGHVGDSRVYRLRDGQLEQMTVDHSLYAELQAAGAPNLPPFEQFPYRNVVTRALGNRGKPRLEVTTEPLEDGDLFLICSDGLTEGLSDLRIEAALNELPHTVAAQALVQEAYIRGSNDNITAVIIQIGTPPMRARIDHQTQPQLAV